ncbi:hypothetical protein [Vibrio maritimus]|uniref:type II toxin-antitoxin system Phd/YefM family antitoxin n=1 Tax=Vibrio maritimus TaxID=990268 RepID=UPI002DD45031|nr:hypothetical protein [Vibrio maritimus]
MAVIEESDGFPVAVLNRSQPVFYCVPAEAYERLMDKLEDIELAQIVEERKRSDEIEVTYKLTFKVEAQKEWKKLDSIVKTQFVV